MEVHSQQPSRFRRVMGEIYPAVQAGTGLVLVLAGHFSPWFGVAGVLVFVDYAVEGWRSAR